VSAIDVAGLVKTFGSGKQSVRALDNLDLSVAESTVMALLGPNGAGKTTTVRILATLLKPDQGTASVLGHDVAQADETVRRLVGLSGQFSAIDENLTGYENPSTSPRPVSTPRAGWSCGGLSGIGSSRVSRCC
jgi:ABC-2 type transport system ATP-binding protein